MPETVERDAVVERHAINGLAAVEAHEPGVGAGVRRPRDRGPGAIPQDHDGVAIGEDARIFTGRNGWPAAKRWPDGASTSSVSACLVDHA